ncbi:MAG: hypothetical protein ABSG53_12090 [Thermoguttaceae bacterium]
MKLIVKYGSLLSLILAVCVESQGGEGMAMRGRFTSDGYRNLRRQPDAVTVITETGTVDLVGDATGAWTGAGIRVTTVAKADGLHVSLAAPGAAVKKLRLHWRGAPEMGWKYLGDAWERGYGDLEWRMLDGKRPMPWYVLASDGRRTHAYGVMTQPAALCCWKLDERGLTLLADVRCGGAGVRLSTRTLEVCTTGFLPPIVSESAFAPATGVWLQQLVLRLRQLKRR